jgi:hypothetical protein
MKIWILLFAFWSSAVPEWTQHVFPAKPAAVYLAAHKAIAAHHEIKSEDAGAHLIRFHVGTTAWSWGYTMILTIEPQGEDSAIGKMSIERSGGPAVSWGSGKKEVGKIFRWTEDNLRPAAIAEPSK